MSKPNDRRRRCPDNRSKSRKRGRRKESRFSLVSLDSTSELIGEMLISRRRPVRARQDCTRLRSRIRPKTAAAVVKFLHHENVRLEGNKALDKSRRIFQRQRRRHTNADGDSRAAHFFK